MNDNIKYYKIYNNNDYKEYWWNNSIISYECSNTRYYKERYINKQLYGIFIKKNKL